MEQMRYEIKPCVEGDADYIWEKDWEAYGSLVPTEKDEEGESFVLKVVDENDAIIGGCVMSIDTSKQAEFARLWVDERYRRQGMASALIRAAERAAREKGCHTVINDYSFDFQASRQLFEKHGYWLIGVAKDWPRGYDHYVLIKRFNGCSEGYDCPKPLDAAAFKIGSGSEEDGEIIADKLEEYNTSFAPRSHPYLPLEKKVVDDQGNIIGGCIAGVSGWDTLHVDTIWVDEPYRNRGIGSFLLSEIEREAKAKGAYIARADAMALQASFLKKHGYGVYAVYEDDPKWDLMQKLL